MFDMSWGEIMVIGGVALIVIGPKDLPKALRTVGQMTSKVRRLAGEFQTQFSEAMREAELEDVKKEMEGLQRDVASGTSSSFNPIQTIRDEIKGAVEAKPGATAGTADPSFAEAYSASSTSTEWSPLLEPPAPASDPAGPLGESATAADAGPASPSRSEAPVDPGTLNPDYINPEVQPPLPPEGEAQMPEEKRA